MKIERSATEVEAARRVAAALDLLLRDKPHANLVLPTGRTPVRLYQELVERAGRGQVDLSQAHVFQLDELVGVPPADPRSYCAFLRRTLLHPLGRPSDLEHLLDGSCPDPEAAISELAQALADRGGADLVLLGLGRNGHVAFNEPGSSLDSQARVTALHPATRSGVESQFGDRPAPTHGMTLGMKEIAGGRALRMLVFGAGKASILKSVLEDPVSPERPASLLRPLDRLTIHADRAAASLLSQDDRENHTTRRR